MKRRRFTEREVLETLWHQGIPIPCHRCGEPITLSREGQREHLHELGLDGPDVPANCRYSHKACHAVVTDGPPATSAGSSKNRIAKARRIPEKMTVRKPRLGSRKPKTIKRKWPKRPFQKRPT